jgi:hypothetical protein
MTTAWRVAANILSNLSRTVKNGGPPAWGLGVRELITVKNNAEYYWVFGLFPSPGILENTMFGNWIRFRPQVKVGEKIHTGPVIEISSF